MTCFIRRIAVLAAAGCVACAPPLDWREFVPEGSGINVTFPCRPDRHTRAVVVAGAAIQMNLLSCTASDTTFALSFFNVTDPSRVTAALIELRATALRNVRSGAPEVVAAQVKGMTANEQAVQMSVSGRLPDGTLVQERAVFFVHGLRVYQATVIGTSPSLPAADVFFGGLRFPA